MPTINLHSRWFTINLHISSRWCSPLPDSFRATLCFNLGKGSNRQSAVGCHRCLWAPGRDAVSRPVPRLSGQDLREARPMYPSCPYWPVSCFGGAAPATRRADFGNYVPARRPAACPACRLAAFLRPHPALPSHPCAGSRCLSTPARLRRPPRPCAGLRNMGVIAANSGVTAKCNRCRLRCNRKV